MNDQQWFNKEPSYFDTILDSWKTNIQKHELYRKLTVNTFDINSVTKERISQIKPIRQV